MRRRPRFVRVSLAVAVALLVAIWPAAALGQGTFRVLFDPPLSELEAQGNPDSPGTLATVTVEVLDEDGELLRDAVVDLTLTAPRFGPLVRSDNPRIEGLELLHTQFAAPDGRFSFDYLLPIRGRYGLDLRATPAAGSGASFEPFETSMPFTLSERSNELLKLILFALGLFLFGLVSAVVLGRSRWLRRTRVSTIVAGERS